MGRIRLNDLLQDECGLAVLEYVLILVGVIMPVAVLVLAAFRYFISVEFIDGLIGDFLFRTWEHLIGAFTYF
jgi:hypothetical protein